jgi:carbamoyltransferase
MNILGINSFFEHPAVALVVNGELVFAIEDERLTRVKHGRSYSPYNAYLPYDAIYKALDFANLNVTDLDEVAYSYDKRLHLMSSIYGCIAGARLSSLRQELAAYTSARNVQRELVEAPGLSVRYAHRWPPGGFSGIPYREWEHHLSHAASAFFCSGFEKSLVVVADGSGEQACTSIYVGDGAALRKIASSALPHSLGFFYSFVTRHLGFQPFGDEYKVMGLAAYGEPQMMEEMRQLVRTERNGRYTVNIRRLTQLDGLLGKARAAAEDLTKQHMDIARSLQARLEEVLLHVVGHYLSSTGMQNLCVAGGTFLNCVANHKLVSELPIDRFFAQPAAHDAGTAIGAAGLSWIAKGGAPQLRFGSMLLGTEWSDTAIEAVLRDAAVTYRSVSRQSLPKETAILLEQEKVVAFFQGRMEFGPRALGARSFLASPRSAATRSRLNIIKNREQFRPLAPIVREEDYETYFDGRPNRYMMLAVPAKAITLSVAPAIVHADGTSRVQVVSFAEDPLLYDVLSEFHQMTGIPILVNTSLNVKGKPIDESPSDALSSAICSGVDSLVIGSFIVDIRTSRVS